MVGPFLTINFNKDQGRIIDTYNKCFILLYTVKVTMVRSWSFNKIHSPNG